MFNDYRHDAVEYYDRFGVPPPVDIEFYRSRVTKTTRLLELGCGTGRVLVPLAGIAGYAHGLDQSSAMLALCRQKLESTNICASRAVVEMADITNFDLTDRVPKFDLITAPFRVMQNLESNEQIAGLMRCIKNHLSSDGEAILNTYHPRGAPDKLKELWDSWDGREPAWTEPDGDGTVSLTENCTRYRDNPLTVFPKLTYRRYNAQGTQVGESVLEFAMRVWYPDELINMIESHGFAVTQRFGGYEGEPWGEARELVVAFRHADVPLH